MEGVEFYIYNKEVWCKHLDGRNEIVDETKMQIIQYIIDKLRNYYPDAYCALEKCYAKSSANVRYFQYLIARRFIKCNFAQLDATSLDIENINNNSKFNFEKHACPMQGECQYEDIVCSPKFNSKLSPAELRVMKPFYQGKSNEEIAQELFLSPGTVKLHIKNAYLKLGIHEKAEFYRYVQDNHLFDN